MNANEKQVAGSHYKAAYQHWDYCIDMNVPYLESAASKYVLRWRKKNGCVDLEKALHYMEKRLESLRDYKGIIKAASKNVINFSKLCASNDLTVREAEIIDKIMHWRNINDVAEVVNMIEDFIQQEQMRGYVNQD